MPVFAKETMTIAIPGYEGDEGHVFGGIVHLRVRKIDNSSNVEWIAWPMSGEPLLLVQYKGGSRYGYLGVSRQRAVAAAYSPSTGSYINERIKPNFEVVKLR